MLWYRASSFYGSVDRADRLLVSVRLTELPTPCHRRRSSGRSCWNPGSFNVQCAIHGRHGSVLSSFGGWSGAFLYVDGECRLSLSHWNCLMIVWRRHLCPEFVLADTYYFLGKASDIQGCGEITLMLKQTLHIATTVHAAVKQLRISLNIIKNINYSRNMWN